MSHLETLLVWLTASIEAVLCVFVFFRKTQRTLPFFAAYSTTMLAGTIGLWFVYERFGFSSVTAYFFYWILLPVNAGMRTLAIAELCRYKLRAYRGIWGLAWRLLGGVSMLFFLHAAVDAWGKPNRLSIYSLTLDRDFDIVSVAILAALLLIHNYYGLSLEPLQRTIAAGICLLCLVDVIGDTVIGSLFTGYLFPFFTANPSSVGSAIIHFYARINDLWTTIRLFSFAAAVGMWCYALRAPLPEPTVAPILLPAEVYRELSPAINLRLNAFNSRMVELLKP